MEGNSSKLGILQIEVGKSRTVLCQSHYSVVCDELAATVWFYLCVRLAESLTHQIMKAGGREKSISDKPKIEVVKENAVLCNCRYASTCDVPTSPE